MPLTERDDHPGIPAEDCRPTARISSSPWRPYRRPHNPDFQAGDLLVQVLGEDAVSVVNQIAIRMLVR